MRRYFGLLTGSVVVPALLLGTAPAPVAGAPAATLAATPRASAPRAATPTASANSRIARVLRQRTRSAVLGSRFTMTVWDTASGAYVYRHLSTASLRGASTTKVLTSVGVLAALGPDHRMPTTVRAGDTASQVILVAGGDPLLTSANLRTLAQRTVAALSSSPGPVEPLTVRADDSLFAGSGTSRGWRTSWVPDEVRAVGAFARDDRPVRDATADAGTYFAGALRRLGVDATFAGEGQASPRATTLATYAGHTVGRAVSHALLVSDNDTAEMLFRQVAVGRGLPATWAGARQAQAKVLTELGIPLAGVRIVDGSGLSLDGRITAPALTTALRRALSPAHPELAGLPGWLPVAGRTGTLQAAYRRFTGSPTKCAAGRIRAKTGTLADAIALAGYARGADGRTKVFVAIVNSRPTRYTRLTTRRAVDRVAASVTGCW